MAVIGLTADASAEARDACLTAGMNDYLSKPLTLEQLQLALERAIGQVPTKAAIA
jgi:CheY-like chemotaxis protein